MFRIMCKSKIHRARITTANLHYEGSIGIDSALMKKADILPGEIVQVANINNGCRFETYAVPEASGSGIIGLYGAAARLGSKGNIVIILSNGIFPDKLCRKHNIKVVKVDSSNRIIRERA